jgi:nucleoside-diphosphate-sugar epimerase
VINIGSGDETSIRDLAQFVIEAVGKTTDWMYMENQDVGPSRMCADISLARAKLGYRPHVKLQEGLERMVEQDPRFQEIEGP